MRGRGAAALATALSLLAGPSEAAPPGDLAAAPPGASACSGCHGVSSATPVPAIAGRPAAEISAALAAFRTGERPATVMNRIATGFSAEESRTIADWLSRQAPK